MPGHNLEQLRSSNRRAVIALLAERGPQSRADLARGTGLSRTTISSLVSELIAAGQVVDTTNRGRPHKGGSGRPPVLVALTTRPGCVAGIDIGHRHVRVAIADRDGRILDEVAAAADTDVQGRRTLDQAAEMLRRLRRDSGVGPDDLDAVAMCVPGPVERRSSRIDGGILPGWRDLSPSAEMESLLGRPVIVDNDANLGAIAEHRHGAGAGRADVVYVKVASGLGAGIVLADRLHRGATGIAGELGHVQVREDGPVCRCGSRGCLETEVSAPRLLRLLRSAYDDVDLDGMLALDAAGDPGVQRVLRDAGRTVGQALSDLVTVLNPAVVVIGGSLGASDSLVRGVRSAVARHAQPDAAAAVEVSAGRLGDRAELVGAVTLANARADQATARM